MCFVRVWDAWNRDICFIQLSCHETCFSYHCHASFHTTKHFFMPCPRKCSCHETFVHTMFAQIFMPRNICSRHARTSFHACAHALLMPRMHLLNWGPAPGRGPGPARAGARLWDQARLGPGHGSGLGPTRAQACCSGPARAFARLWPRGRIPGSRGH